MLIYLSLIESEENKSKFEEIYNSYKKTMFYVANDILKNHAQAEDVVHTSFIKIINNLEKIDEVNCNKTKGFIVTIVKNTAIDVYRNNKREFEKVEKVIGIKSYEEKPLLNVKSDIEMAILELPDKYSVVFSLKYYQGLSDDEISNILKIKPSTVRSRISRGKEKLRKILDEMRIINNE
ncbi:MAG: RNA polymerase sigma factor [Paraclostridium sp.]